MNKNKEKCIEEIEMFCQLSEEEQADYIFERVLKHKHSQFAHVDDVLRGTGITYKLEGK